MKKILSFALVIVMVFAFCSCGEKHDFRNVDFGMTMEQVKKAEKNLEPRDEYEISSSGSIWYDAEIESVSGKLDYSFSDGKLNDISFISNPSENYMEDFETLKKYLIKNYGEPWQSGENTIFWKSDSDTPQVSISKDDEEQNVDFVIFITE